MTQQDINEIEGKLSVTLPASYKTIVLSYPWPEFAGSIDYSLWDIAALNIERTIEYRNGYGGAPAWPSNYVHIGDDEDACPYVINCSDGSILKTDHGNLTKLPLQTFPNAAAFVERLNATES